MPLAALVVAALVITFLVVGGDPGVKDGDRAITNAKEFAESQTQAWEEGLPEKGLAKADGAQCFYLADEASEEVTKQLACGPVRRPLTSDKQVWDTYAYTVTPGSKDDEATAEAPDEEPQRAQELPGSTILVNGDGEQVEIDGAGLKEPDIPTADENTIWKAGSFSVEEDDKGAALPTSGQANVAGLGTQFALDSIVEVEAATIDASITQPAEGQKLYLLTLSGTTAANGFSGENTLSLNVGDQTEAIDDPSKAPVSLLVSAPDGGPLNLVVDSEGKNQTLNLITGERTGDPGTEWLYTDGQPKTHDPGVSFTLPRASQSNGVYFDLTIKVDSVSVSGYRNGEGWAADGQQFIEMAISSSGVTNSTTTVYYELDCASSTINEGTVSCQAGALGTATIMGTAAAGGQVTLNFAGQLLTSDQQYTVSNGYPVPFQTTSATVALPA
ncbi:hypothetical protein [Blastococcus sp. Marseille-P5729]|uniref:hypothetical protein n=1 Tax=Blastococcus sp. Marseille-P5729 TaxID=2086582 RepID=UPI00131A9BB4|nr:hypothetical protein [Blastococcus sp. Marseille-P5729]